MATSASQIPGAGSQGSLGTEDTRPNQNPEGGTSGQGTSDGQGSGTQTTKYKVGSREFDTPEEMAQYASSLVTMVAEQGKALNTMAARQGGSEGVQPTGRPTPAQGSGVSSGTPSAAENAAFWDNPLTALRSEMQQMIEPFRRDMAASQQQSAVVQLRGEFSGYADLEPMVDAAMAQTGQARTYDNLRAAYFMVKGYMAETGQLAPAGRREDSPSEGGNGNGGNGPPQHRPSSAPLPSAPSGTGRKRALTEDERRIARIGGLSEEQYLALIDLDEEDVVTSKIGQADVK